MQDIAIRFDCVCVIQIQIYFTVVSNTVIPSKHSVLHAVIEF